jgi:hypothetical protein
VRITKIPDDRTQNSQDKVIRSSGYQAPLDCCTRMLENLTNYGYGNPNDNQSFDLAIPKGS